MNLVQDTHFAPFLAHHICSPSLTLTWLVLVLPIPLKVERGGPGHLIFITTASVLQGG